MDDLILLISQQKVGEQVTLTILRDGQETELTVVLAARPDGPTE
jgi:S1-C subfamily serine protease